ncbi:hypothetical protein O4J56_16960 [Nocardiopsis sp. RSe5-2]|uniref:Uncharacterized protein n=1 Tax=Nocardiopsis endophytica TaxID=3018445 RepID=A0ABT4U5V2_9ACTN|nr:hypothetical protein [Nocardiopsis endophytica]MDA2812334.1 hypothetical protein [Nocardiopsis endophytica]
MGTSDGGGGGGVGGGGGAGRGADRPPGRVTAYLSSTRNLVGAGAGLVGVALAFTGVLGPLWPLAVVALYVAGALAAPPERVRLAAEAVGRTPQELQQDLEGLARTVGRSRSRLPGDAAEAFERLRGRLADLLELDTDLEADPETAYELERVVRTDLPEAVEAYLNLPWWFDAGRRAGGGGSAAEELRTQLALLEASVGTAAERLLEAHTRRQRDHTTYLRERERSTSSAPEVPPGAAPSAPHPGTPPETPTDDPPLQDP